jgi:hypothetical protein
VTRRGLALFLSGLVVTVFIAVVVSQFASSEPDGLEYVAEQEGFAGQVEEHALTDAPLADYGENLSTGNRLSTGIAGLVGVVVAMGLGFGLFWMIRAPRPGPPGPSS